MSSFRPISSAGSIDVETEPNAVDENRVNVLNAVPGPSAKGANVGFVPLVVACSAQKTANAECGSDESVDLVTYDGVVESIDDTTGETVAVDVAVGEAVGEATADRAIVVPKAETAVDATDSVVASNTEVSEGTADTTCEPAVGDGTDGAAVPVNVEGSSREVSAGAVIDSESAATDREANWTAFRPTVGATTDTEWVNHKENDGMVVSDSGPDATANEIQPIEGVNDPNLALPAGANPDQAHVFGVKEPFIVRSETTPVLLNECSTAEVIALPMRTGYVKIEQVCFRWNFLRKMMW